MFPSHARIYCAAVQMDDYMEDNISYWQNVYGFNMLPVATRVLEVTFDNGYRIYVDIMTGEIFCQFRLLTRT